MSPTGCAVILWLRLVHGGTHKARVSLITAKKNTSASSTCRETLCHFSADSERFLLLHEEPPSTKKCKYMWCACRWQLLFSEMQIEMLWLPHAPCWPDLTLHQGICLFVDGLSVSVVHGWFIIICMVSSSSAFGAVHEGNMHRFDPFGVCWVNPQVEKAPFWPLWLSASAERPPWRTEEFRWGILWRLAKSKWRWPQLCFASYPSLPMKCVPHSVALQI